MNTTPPGLVRIHGRVQWDRDIAVTVATWIQMHRDRLERQREGIIAERRASGDKVLDIDTRGIERKLEFLLDLIVSVDDGFSIHDYALAKQWIDNILVTSHEDSASAGS